MANNGANDVRQSRTGSISNASTISLKPRDGALRPAMVTSVSNGNLEQRSQAISVERSRTMAGSSEHLRHDQSAFSIAPNHKLASFLWFVGSMDRKQAAELLHPRVAGTFLVRESIGTPNEFAISLQYNNTVKHMRIYHSDLQPGSIKWYLCDGRMFDSVPDLIAYYETNTLNSAFSDVDCTLAYPFRENIECFVVAMYDYNPTDGKLCFAENDRIAVISKAADERGWWKGRLNGRSGYFPKSYVREDD